MSLTIEKAKLIKGGEKVDIAFTRLRDDGTRSSGSEIFNASIHPDLQAAFKNLTIHFAILTGQIPIKSIKDIINYKEDLIEGFKVSSYSIGGENEGVTLTGTRLLWNGKPFNFNSPYYLFTEAPETRYTFMDDLVAKLGRVDEELKLYMNGTKRGADAQLQMFEEDKPTKIKVAEPAKPLENGWLDVTDEYKGITAAALKQADPEAMARVAAVDHEETAIITEEWVTPKSEDIPPVKKKGRPKKVAQSADAPSGMIEDIEEAE